MLSLNKERKLRIFVGLTAISIFMYYNLKTDTSNILERECEDCINETRIANASSGGLVNDYRNFNRSQKASDGIKVTTGVVVEKILSADDVSVDDRANKWDHLRRSETQRIPHAAKSYYIHEPEIDCNQPNTYVFYVYSGRNRTDRRQLIRETWGRLDQYRNVTVNLQLFFVLGVSGDKMAKGESSFSHTDIALEEEVRQYGDILMCDVIDSYINLTRKGLAALKWINSICDVNNLEFLFKTDDDVYISMAHVLDLANESIENGSHFLGVLNANSRVHRTGKWGVSIYEYSNKIFPTYCLGIGYGITRKGFVLLMNSIDKVPLFPLEDVFFTGLAIPWAQPNVNIRYYPVDFHNAKVLLTDYKIQKIIKRKTRTERFVMGHPVPEHLWFKVHNAINGIAQT
ncbi:hypothetical protein LSH36_547g05013 [Paralvinella palmiformis]|uniref:Hexosyltransferase n=1 Tax=Paralvinella palmiformis TaxID=53620 RepID=A0AAD9J6U2_9ANNE|nr:hypothetical protein LSH36_547g05013 [Paralvinella palmiformis]